MNNNDLTVVGIGASAGGLEAIQQLFKHIPSSTGLAFVVIQHLSPDFKSLMPELLAKYTDMKIYTAKNNQVLKPNCIYLNKGNKNLLINGGRLLQKEKDSRKNLNLPIDIFFHSLGDEFKENAVGIILSGTGMDGSRGIRTIKESGGIVISQEPDSAQFDGMPNAAISTNLVDFVAEPKEIAGILEKLLNRNITILQQDAKDKSDEIIFQEILDEIKKNSGIDFKNYKRGTLLRRLEKRMHITNLDQIFDYLTYLKSNENEKFILKNDFLIGVTSFFRDTDAFDIIQHQVIPELVERKKDSEGIRIWVAACSTGEEVYSIAMLVDDYLQSHGINLPYKIFATDVDTQALEFASVGLYHINIADEIDRYFLEKYFVKIGEKIQIVKRIRKNIVFSRHNTLIDPPFIHMDMISCRNMLIYMENKAQKKVMHNFQFALKKKGYLFLGSSESTTDYASFYRTIDPKWNIFQSLMDSKSLPFENNTHNQSRKFNQPRISQTDSIRTEYRFKEHPELAFYHFLNKKLNPSTFFIDSEYNVLFVSGDAVKHIHFQGGLVRNNLLKLIDSELAGIIRTGIRRLKNESKDVIIKNVELWHETNSHIYDIGFYKAEELKGYQNAYMIVLSEAKQIDDDTIQIQNKQLDEDAQKRFEDIEMELKSTKSELRNVVEELETSNEELQSSNEELMASNEELQSTNEELQSVNEELYTVNSELQEKNKELLLLNNDINNLLDNSDVATVFVDTKMKIRKFTPALKKLFSLQDNDLGRPISIFTSSFSDDIRVNILFDCEQAIKKRTFTEKEIEDVNGNHFLKRISPFITDENKIEGAIITLIDINPLFHAKKELFVTETRFTNLFNRLTAGFSIAKILFNEKNKPIDWEYLIVNPAFEELVGMSLNDIIGKRGKDIRVSAEDDNEINWLETYSQVALEQKQQRIEVYAAKQNRYYQMTIFSPQKGEFAVIYNDISQLKQQEQKIKLSEQWFRSVFENSPIGKSITQLDGSIKVNKQFSQIVGYSEKELNQLHWQEITHPDDLQLSIDAVEKIKKSTTPVRFRKRYIHKNGSVVWTDVTSIALMEPTNKDKVFLTSISDITLLVNAEEKLQKSEQRYQLATEASDNGIWDWYTDSEQVFYSNQWKAQLGYKPQELENNFSTWENLLHPDDKERMLQNVEDFLQNPSNFFMHQFRMLHKDGTYRWIQNRASAVLDDQGKVVRMFGAHKDITDQKLAEEEVRKTDKMYRGFIENASDGVMLIGEDKKLKFASESAARMLGYSLKEFLASNPIEYTHPDDLPAINKAIIASSQKQNTHLLDYRIRHKKGHYLWIESTFSKSKDKEGNPAVVINFRNIQERKEYEEELVLAKQRAETASIHKNQFLANMSHEIRTPMNSVIGFTGLLKDRKTNPAEQNRYLDIIDSNANQLLNLIDDIIDVAKIEAKELKIMKNECDLVETIKEIETTYQQVVQNNTDKDVKLRLDIPKDLQSLVIFTDCLRLRQVLINLLNNAIKFTHKGHITFGFKEQKDTISFFVKDTGIGIPKDKLTEIFEEFKQVQYENSAQYGGTGLGLAICKGILELLGGEISIESEVGKGSSFEFSIPKELVKSHKSKVLKSDQDKSEFLKDKTILIVDDEPMIRIYFNEIFKFSSCKLIYAENGKEGVDTYLNTPSIDLVLMDIRMPIMNGFKAMEMILTQNPHAVIVAQTAHAMPEEKEKCFELGCKGYITKPILQAKLFELLYELL
jgi:two-component system CheB/CheR fusion protein